MRAIARTLLALVLLCGIAAAAEPAGGGLPAEAAKAVEAGNWQQAVELLTPLAKDQANEAANYWLGAAHFYLGQMAQAQAPLQAAVKANPRCRAAAVMLAQCTAALCLSDTRRVSALDPALEAFPFDAEVAHWAGRAWMNRYFFEQWYAKTEEALAQRGRGYLLRAVQEFERAAKLKSDYAENERWLAFALLRVPRADQSAEHARNAVRLAPAGWETYVTMSSALTRLGRHEEAARAFEGAQLASPAMSTRMNFERGRALLIADHFTEAADAFRATIYADKGYPFARHWLACAAVPAKDYGLALWAVKESRMLDAKLIDDAYWTGRCAYGVQNYELAEQLIGKAVAEARGFGARPGSEWLHYLGRTQWALGKRDEALKNLALACERRPGDLAFARWLFAAYVENDDLYKAVMLCDQVADSGNRDAAGAWLEAMLKKWPGPRFKDFRAKKLPHDRAAREVLGNIRYEQRRYFASHYWFEAAKCCAKGKYTRTRPAWAALRTGRRDEARRIFREFLTVDLVFRLRKSSMVKHKQNDADRDYGRLGLGTVLALDGKWEESYANFAAITRESWEPMKTSGMLWGAIALKKPEARQLADPYTLLGMIHNRNCGRDRGIEILAVLPGTLLDGHTPAIGMDDRLVRVGEMSLGHKDQLKEFREADIPTKPLKALIRRGTREFEITLDYPAALKRLPAPPAKVDEGEEVAP